MTTYEFALLTGFVTLANTIALWWWHLWEQAYCEDTAEMEYLKRAVEMRRTAIKNRAQIFIGHQKAIRKMRGIDTRNDAITQLLTDMFPRSR